jgi:hypothetical protein
MNMPWRNRLTFPHEDPPGEFVDSHKTLLRQKQIVSSWILFKNGSVGLAIHSRNDFTKNSTPDPDHECVIESDVACDLSKEKSILPVQAK